MAARPCLCSSPLLCCLARSWLIRPPLLPLPGRKSEEVYTYAFTYATTIPCKERRERERERGRRKYERNQQESFLYGYQRILVQHRTIEVSNGIKDWVAHIAIYFLNSIIDSLYIPPSLSVFSWCV